VREEAGVGWQLLGRHVLEGMQVCKPGVCVCVRVCVCACVCVCFSACLLSCFLVCIPV